MELQKSKLWVCLCQISLVVVFAACPVFGQILAEKRDLTVKVGRSVYLDRGDLMFRRTRKDEACRVEVVKNDPITQRAGFLEPQIFDCVYLADTVRYVHKGSPLLTEDKVKLRVHRFTQTKTVSETFYLNVKVINSSLDIVVTRGLRHVIVPTLNQISNAIDASVMRFHHRQSQNVSCTVGFSNYKSHWPLVGHILLGDEAVEAVRRDCQEFLLMNLRYQHFGSLTPEVDYLPLEIEVLDPDVSNEVVSERFYLPIYIKGALLNSPPRSSYTSMYMMDVDQFVLSPIIPGIISAEDVETPVSKLVYNISKPPGENEGYFVSLDDHTTPITSFLQEDLENHQIGYQPPNISFAERKIYEVEFVVFDSHFSKSMAIVLHIAVRTSSTNAPRVSFNKGLVLLEGQVREITTNNIQIVDRDSLSSVGIYVTGGLRHGQLLLTDQQTVYFTIDDLESGRLKYIHDDSDTLKDSIDLRISDGPNTVLVNFPIQVVPKDDSTPYIIINMGLELNEGQIRRIRETMLLAHDTDSVDNNIIYSISQPPEAGEIIRRIRPTETGTRVNKFTQRDIKKGMIYYRHFGHENFRDLFKFTLKDNHDPPNESGQETFYIEVHPVNENPPQLSPEATRLMHVLETDIAFITKTELAYTDVETDDNQLTYIITSPPYFVYDRGQDAGRIIATHNLTMVTKNGSIPAIQTFKQEDINHMKIAYMPPLVDIGPEARLVRFVYTVQDSSRNQVLGQYFDIDVQPVNDKPPEFSCSKLLVEEGGVLAISTSQISVSDSDTILDDLVFSVEELPRHGEIQNGGINLVEDGSFSIHDLRRKDIRYIHDGSEVTEDSFTLTLSDGVNRVSSVLSVEIVPIDDEAPRVQANLKPHLIVSEGSEASITSRVLAATDGDTEDGTLIFLIIKQPKYGIMQLSGQPVTKFSQEDVKLGRIRYLHTGGEIGSDSVKDSVTFIVSDQNFMATADLPVFELNITITPVDNQRPNVIMGAPIIVNEGEKFTFSPDVFTAKDPDTNPEEIQFMITQQPRWGYLENIKPSPGSEKSNAGISVSSFRLQDIIDQSINYVQATHKGVEPTADEFQFYATDGKLNSPSETASITIIPVNDEEPDVMLNDFTITEGGSKIIDRSMVDAVDMDLPKEPIMLSISQPPEHGDIVILLQTKNGAVEASVHDFSVDELHSGMQLKYRHDNSEHFTDKFALTVSDGKHQVKKLCNISIEAMNDARPEVLKNAGLQLEYGEYSTISSAILQSFDEDNSPDEVFYIIVSLPKKGSLQFCPDPFSPSFMLLCRDLHVGMNFSQTDVDSNHVRYIHTTSMSGTETDSFLFVLTDGINKRHVETFEIRIRNSKKANIALFNKGLNIREGERALITTFNLSASDESTRGEEIVFAIIRPPRLGQLEYIDRPLVSVTSFTQLDLASSKIVYNHLTKTDFTEDSFTFTVTNGLSDAKDGLFRIHIDPLDKILPTLMVNNLVEVLQGSEISITQYHLRAQDPDTSHSNVTYLIAKPPTYGHLYNRGILITHLFTQSEVDRGFITYESDGTHTGLDNFLFVVSDGRHDGFLINGTLHTQPTMCSIFIKPLVNDAPKMLTMEHPEVLEYFRGDRYGFRLNSRVLKAVDSDTDNNQLIYVMVKRPQHGHLENVEAKRYVRRRFSQRDLDDNTIQYIVDDTSTATNDSFIFRVEDSRGNSLDNQRFDLKWSIVEFTHSDLVVCENVGTLTLTLKRKGALNKLAFVSINARGLSARKNDDYIPSQAQQIQFEPGATRATWDIVIRDDHLEESNEKFRVTLSDPVNTVLGAKSKVRIRLIDTEPTTGDCPQYLGMISKQNPDIPETDGFFLPRKVDSESGETDTELHHVFTGLNRRDPFDNTYNTDPDQTDVEEGGLLEGPEPEEPNRGPPSSSKRDKKKKKPKKNRKGKKSRRRSRNKGETDGGRKKKKQKAPDEIDEVENTNQKLIPVSNLQAPQKCTATTKGLLYFDMFYQQMFKCNGGDWQAWSAVSNQDQQPDSQQCQQGWSEHQGRCYKFINERLTWEVAETLCQMSHDAHLTTITSKHHMGWLSDLAGKKSFWIGLNDKLETGTWTYTSGDALTYTKWTKGGPRMKRMLHKKNCVLVHKKRYWKNKICNKPKARLICEQNIRTLSQGRSPPKRHISRSRNPDRAFFFG